MEPLKQYLLSKDYCKVQELDFDSETKRFVEQGCKILNIIFDYRKGCKELYEHLDNKSGAMSRAFSKLLLSKDDFAQDPIHYHYYEKLQEDSRLLQEQMCNANFEVINEFADAIMKELTVPASKKEDYAQINYDADDNMFSFLVEKMSDDGLKMLCKDYYKRNLQSLLPNQEKLLIEIRRVMMNRGFEVPKKRLFRSY